MLFYDFYSFKNHPLLLTLRILSFISNITPSKVGTPLAIYRDMITRILIVVYVVAVLAFSGFTRANSSLDNESESKNFDLNASGLLITPQPQ